VSAQKYYTQPTFPWMSIIDTVEVRRLG